MIRITVLLGVSTIAISACAAPKPAAQTAEVHAIVCAAPSLQAAVGPRVEIASATEEAAPAGLCRVRGAVITRGGGAPDGRTTFELNLPKDWNGRFLFLGGGGFDGVLPVAPPDLLARGYVTVGADSGHLAPQGHPNPAVDISWVRDATGARNHAAMLDYAWRSRTQVNEFLRPLVTQYYGGEPVRHAYFMGCSGGGREALIEAQRNPDSYDGFIAGDPPVNGRAGLLNARNFKALLAAPIPYAKFAEIDKAVLADCDARDGAKDGLIQNPAACAFDPKTLVASGVLTAAQADALAAYLSAPRDTSGRFVSYGMPVAGMGDLSPAFGHPPGAGGGLTGLSAFLTDPPPAGKGPQPWGEVLRGPINWPLTYGVVTGLVFNDPNMDAIGPKVLDGLALQPSAVAAADNHEGPAVVEPSKMGRFFASKGKLIVYQGYADTIVDPYSLLGVWRQIEATGGAAMADHARLFMVPDMQHCAGGTGPNQFDALSALEAWVEKGVAPDAIIAAHHSNNDPRQPADRTMPLCAYPAAARYDGHGEVKDASSWSCSAGDHRQLDLGPDGRAAGLDQQLPRR